MRAYYINVLISGMELVELVIQSKAVDPIKFTSHAAQLHVDAPMEGNLRKKLSQKAGQVCLSLDAIASRDHRHDFHKRKDQRFMQLFFRV